MKQMLLLILFASITIAFGVPSAFAETPIGYPWSTWGEVSWSEGDNDEGLKLDSYAEQGIDWWKVSDWTFNSFAGLRLVTSTEDDDFWNNKVGLWLGAKTSREFQLFPNSSGIITLGYRWEGYEYFSESISDSRHVLFGQWWTGGNWKQSADKFPIAWPWSTWGELTWASGDFDEGVKVDAYAEQGVVVAKIEEWDIIPFIGLRVVQSTEDDEYWNNKVGPWFGIKGSRNVLGGIIQVGVRGEYYSYTRDSRNNDLRGVLFLTWWFGGDHNK